jgi:predicted LPLAT superfamily acyltransferase
MTWKGKSRGGHLGYKVFIYVLKILGLKAAYLLLRFVSFYYVFFVPKSTQASYRYFRKIQGFGFFKSIRKVFANYYIFGQTLIDKTVVLGGMGDKFSFDHDGLDYLNDLATQQTGAILISAHIGNYEMAGHLLDRLEVPVNIVMYDAEHQKIKDLFASIYGDRQVNIIPIKDNDFSHIIAIKNALDRKEVICLHGDRFVEGNQTIEVDFMGHKALFPYGPFLLINKFKVPYSMVFAVKESDAHYHFFASKPQVTTGSIDDVLKNYIQAVEEKLRAYPEQWFNFYDFWNFYESRK